MSKKAMKKETIGTLRNAPDYIQSFMTKGNKKLTDYMDEYSGIYYKYAQFNLPARKTCPFATDDCYKFCYAIRDERFPAPRNNRTNSLQATKDPLFVHNMIFTINSELDYSKRYEGAVMILRIHESGEFYRQQYLNDMIDIISHFLHRYDNEKRIRIIFQFYTKAFRYFVNLDNERKDILRKAIRAGIVAMSLSYDKSMKQEQRNNMLKVYSMFPGCNIYAAVKEKDLNTFEHNKKCDCADCAKCGKCVHTDGSTVAVAIH